MALEIAAPLSGKVLGLSVNAGDRVDEDEEIMVIEAMKMETPVYVPCDGTVREIRVANEDEVAENDVLALVDEA